MLLKNFRVALGEASQVFCALGSWLIGSCMICLAAHVGVNGSPPWKRGQEIWGFEEGPFVSA